MNLLLFQYFVLLYCCHVKFIHCWWPVSFLPFLKFLKAAQLGEMSLRTVLFHCVDLLHLFIVYYITIDYYIILLLFIILYYIIIVNVYYVIIDYLQSKSKFEKWFKGNSSVHVLFLKTYVSKFNIFTTIFFRHSFLHPHLCLHPHHGKFFQIVPSEMGLQVSHLQVGFSTSWYEAPTRRG